MNQPNNKEIKYRWREPFNNKWHETSCEVISHNDKTALIKLLGFGKNGKLPGTKMRVRLKSLIGLNIKTQQSEPDLSWHSYTYFD